MQEYRQRTTTHLFDVDISKRAHVVCDQAGGFINTWKCLMLVKKVIYMPGGIRGVAAGSVQVSIRGLAAFAIDLVVSPVAQKNLQAFA